VAEPSAGQARVSVRSAHQFRSAGWPPKRRLNDCSVALAHLLSLGSARCAWPLAGWVGL